MKNDLLEDRRDDWLAQEYQRENLRNNLDLDDAKKLKDEHYREHKGKESKVNNSSDIKFDFLIALFIFGLILLFLFPEFIYNLMFY